MYTVVLKMLMGFKKKSGWLALVLGAIVVSVNSGTAFAQNRIDLDDLQIKGELLNDNRLRLSARDQYQITDRVTYRKNFRKEISDGLEIAWPEADSPSRGAASQSSEGGP